MRRSRRDSSPDICQVSGCSAEAERSMPRKKVKEALDKGLKGEGKRVQICKPHYREYKKATKDERKMEALRR